MIIPTIPSSCSSETKVEDGEVGKQEGAARGSMMRRKRWRRRRRGAKRRNNLL